MKHKKTNKNAKLSNLVLDVILTCAQFERFFLQHGVVLSPYVVDQFTTLTDNRWDIYDPDRSKGMQSTIKYKLHGV